jgi:hypothetical protein
MDVVSQQLSRLFDTLSFDTALLTQPAMIVRLSLQTVLFFCSAFLSGAETPPLFVL